MDFGWLTLSLAYNWSGDTLHTGNYKLFVTNLSGKDEDGSTGRLHRCQRLNRTVRERKERFGDLVVQREWVRLRNIVVLVTSIRRCHGKDGCNIKHLKKVEHTSMLR